MNTSNSWQLYAILSLLFHGIVLSISQGFWVEADSLTFVDLAKTQSLSYCTSIGYPVFLFIFGLGAKFLWIPIFVQVFFRSCITGLILAYITKKYHLPLRKNILIWIIFHVEPQQIYYNTCLMAESLLISVCMAQWYVWQQYRDTKKMQYLWLLLLFVGAGLYLKPIAVVNVVLLAGYALLKLKSRYKILAGVLSVYIIFYVTVSMLYYWRYSNFEPDVFKGILFWNNASVLTPMLKKDHFETYNPEINHVLQMMYNRKDAEYAFEQDDNRIFEDSSFTQQYIQNQMKQGKTYRETIVHTNIVFGKVAKEIVIHYPIPFLNTYIVPNTVEWIRALCVPHVLTGYVPAHLTQVHTHAKTYAPQPLSDALHTLTKLIFLTVAIVGTFILTYKKQKNIFYAILSVWFFILMYIVMNILLHPLEYRYIYPVLAGTQLISACCVADYLNSGKNKDKVL
jgi:hypothetical protein